VFATSVKLMGQSEESSGYPHRHAESAKKGGRPLVCSSFQGLQRNRSEPLSEPFLCRSAKALGIGADTCVDRKSCLVRCNHPKLHQAPFHRSASGRRPKPPVPTTRRVQELQPTMLRLQHPAHRRGRMPQVQQRGLLLEAVFGGRREGRGEGV